jgi:DNA-binding transcriptional LysR family regulator
MIAESAMELRHLRYFIAVAEELSFRRAAERLHISHSPLNRQVHELERELGVPLFVPNTHGVMLSNAGQVYLKEARQIIAQSRQAVNLARAAAEGKRGSIRIAQSVGYMDPALPAAMRSLRDEYPDVRIDLIQCHARDQFTALIADELDLGFCAINDPNMSSSLVFEQVRASEIGIVVPVDHALARSAAVTIDELMKCDFISTNPYGVPQHHNWFQQLCAEAGFTPNNVYTVDSMQSMLGMVGGGVGIAFMPKLSLQRLAAADVEFVPLDGLLRPFVYHMAWHRSDPSPILQLFLEILRRHLHLDAAQSIKTPLAVAKPMFGAAAPPRRRRVVSK